MSTTNSNDMKKAQGLVDALGAKNVIVKRIKKEKGLIEHDEKDATIILEEDNRQLFLD